YYRKREIVLREQLGRKNAQKTYPWLLWKYELARCLAQNPPHFPTVLSYGSIGWPVNGHPENVAIPGVLGQWPGGIRINQNRTPTGEELFFEHYAPMEAYYPKLADENIIRNGAHIYDFISLFCGTNLLEECIGDTKKTAL